MRRPPFLAWGYVALWAALMMQLGAIAAAAAPFAYVANSGDNTVSVIDTATNKVVATVPVTFVPFGGRPRALAVTPDGTKVYVTSYGGSVIVINATTNKVAATVPRGISFLYAAPIAITPDGKKAYVGEGAEEVPFNFIAAIDTATNTELGDDIPWPSSSCCLAVSPDGKYLYTIGIFELTELSAIDTATNARVGGLEFGGGVPAGLAITPDGKAVYLSIDTNVLVINTATRTVVATVPGVAGPVAITPDGKRAYVASSPVSVIDTATNTVVAKVPVGSQPSWVAVTPDGKYAYVTNQGSNNVSVIDTASNTVRATVAVGDAPVGVGIIPPPPGVPFSAFSAKLEVHLGHKPNTDHFNLNASFTLGSASNGINPPTEPVTLKVGTFTTTIPPNSFKIADDQDDQNDQEEGVGMKRFGPFRFHGVIDGVRWEVGIEPTGAKRYAFHANAHDANLAGTTNPVTVTLIIGDDSGTTPVKAEIQ